MSGKERHLPLSELRKLKVGGFRPKPHYDAESDTLTLFIAPDEARRERVDRFLTVYRARETNAVVGCLVKDVRSVLLKNLQSMHLGIEARSVQLWLLLYLVPLVAEGDVGSRKYREVIEPLSRVAATVNVLELIAAN